MSLFDRLANVARGKVRQMINGSSPSDPLIDEELRTARPPAPSTTAPRPVARPPERDPAEDPVPRSDLLGPDEGEL